MHKLMFRELVCHGDQWTNSSKAIINDMLEVWDVGHYITIHELDENIIIGEKNEYLSTNWIDLPGEVDQNKVVGYVSASNNAEPIFKHVQKVLGYNKDNEIEDEKPMYLIIIEEDGLGGQIVRGIFARKNNKLLCAESPLYEDYKPVTIWDKKSRLNTLKIKSIDEFMDSFAQYTFDE